MRTLAIATFAIATPLSAAAADAAAQACTGEAARARKVAASAVKAGESVAWSDRTLAVRLDVAGTGAVCWVDVAGKVQKLAIGEPRQNADVGKAQACAGEASQIRRLPLSAVREEWWSEGPGGALWVRLTVSGHKADCRIDAAGEV